jgi:hypothetical protein
MLRAREEHIGQQAICPSCRSLVKVPDRDFPALPDEIKVIEPDERPLEPVRRRRSEPDRPRRRRLDEEDRPRRRTRQAEVETSTKAVLALVFGLLSMIGMFCTGIPAIILAIVGLREVQAAPGRVTGRGLAWTGLIAGVVGTFVVPVLVTILVVMPIYEGVASTGDRVVASNNLKQIGLAMHIYHDNYARFPPAALRGPDGRPLLSWRVALLPFLEQQHLYNQFRLDEPWDSPNNRRLLQQMPRVYAIPGDAKSMQAGLTCYQVFAGPNTAFDSPRGNSSAQITDGLSATIFVAEAARPVEWTKPDDLPFQPNGPLPALGGHFYKKGFFVLLGDGSVRWLDNSVDERTRRLLIQRNSDVAGKLR